MAQLAIKGHATRGEEVIKILEMLGGENRYELVGNSFHSVYLIKNKVIVCESTRFVEGIKWFSLEEFRQKFPYKIGDKVLYKIYNVYSSIKSMTWNEEKEQVIYRLDSQKLLVATADELTKDIKHRRFLVDVTIPYGDEYKDAEDLQETIQDIFDCQCDDKGRWKVKVEYINEKG